MAGGREFIDAISEAKADSKSCPLALEVHWTFCAWRFSFARSNRRSPLTSLDSASAFLWCSLSTRKRRVMASYPKGHKSEVWNETGSDVVADNLPPTWRAANSEKSTCGPSDQLEAALAPTAKPPLRRHYLRCISYILLVLDTQCFGQIPITRD